VPRLGRPIIFALLAGLVSGFVMAIIAAGWGAGSIENDAAIVYWLADPLTVIVSLVCAAFAYLIARRQNKPFNKSLRFRRFVRYALVGSVIGAFLALLGSVFLGGILLCIPGALLCGLLGLRLSPGCPASGLILSHILPANAIGYGLLAGLLSLPLRTKKQPSKTQCKKCMYKFPRNSAAICPKCGRPITKRSG
jgi:hypothetical protein